jgi:GTP pyrophosphokinase
MDRKEFFAKVHQVVDPKEWERMQVAYWFSKTVHEKTPDRASGERYFEHCKRSAWNLMEYSDDPHDADAAITGLLHDSVEDCFIPQDIIRALFGKYIQESVEVLSKVIPVFGDNDGFIMKHKKSNDDYYSGIARADRRIARVKLADRLDNFTDMNGWDFPRKMKYLCETEKHIIPLCDKDKGLGNKLLLAIVAFRSSMDAYR